VGPLKLFKLSLKPLYEEDYQMRYPIILIIMVLTAALCSQVMADTLEMVDGSLVEGRYVTSNESYFIFDAGGEIKAIPVDEVAALYLSAGVEKAILSAAVETEPEPLTLPAGTRMLVTISETIDSSRHRAGHRFRAQLEGDLVVRGTTVVRRGSYVFGQISEARQARRLAGRSELQVEFTDIMIDGQIFPISTTGLEAQASGAGAQTLGRTARAAAIGGLIGGSSGARTGAAVGAGASIITRGASVNIPRGTIVETTLAEPLAVL
jgi:hypothetical protein